METTALIVQSNSLEGVVRSFVTYFFNSTTVTNYSELFNKIAIVITVLLVYWIIKTIFGIFKKRR